MRGIEHPRDATDRPIADRRREAFPRARSVTLAHSAHRPFADDPDGFTEEVLPWLREQAAAPRLAALVSGYIGSRSPIPGARRQPAGG